MKVQTYNPVLCALALFLILSSGALGLVSESSCKANGKGYLSGDRAMGEDYYGERIACYHQAAVSAAAVATPGSIEARTTAARLCNSIMTEVGYKPAVQGTDIELSARNEANMCYSDIARLLHDSSLCNGIVAGSHVSTLTGADVTTDLCVKQAKSAAQITQGAYLTGKDNMCNITFILPLILLGALLVKR